MEIRIYGDADGREPFRRWVAALDREARHRVDVAIGRLRAGNTSALKSIGSGIAELRIDWGPGYRIYLGRMGDELVILLGGGTKSRQQDDIAAAKVHWMDYKSRRME